MSATAATRPRMDAVEYLAWERGQPERHEYLRGEVFAMSGGSVRHAALIAAATAELVATHRGGPCRVLSTDQRIAVREGEHYVYADVTVVCGQIETAAGTNDVLRNPTIVVEVLSASTEAYDRGVKWDGYQRLSSVMDYLLVSQTTARIEHFRRHAEGEWRYHLVEAGGRLTLSSGAVLAVDDIYAGVFDLEGD
jgi:Uma2 family endonuclease